jgi:hypothetical protein
LEANRKVKVEAEVEGKIKARAVRLEAKGEMPNVKVQTPKSRKSK